MKIIANRKDEILRRKEEYESEFRSRKEQHQNQHNMYRRAQQEIFDSVQSAVLAELQGIDLDLQVNVGNNFGDIKVGVSSNEGNVHGEDKALSWTWTVVLDDEGTISTSSSSWSGLQATTKEQLESLRQTVTALEILNDIDWGTLLNVTLPAYREYITVSDPSYDPNKPNFDQELREIEIEEAMGKRILLHGKPIRMYRGRVWYGITRETATQYEVFYIPDYAFEFLEASNDGDVEALVNKYKSSNASRVSKAKLLSVLDAPLVTKEY